jgi:U3 small nucleolar RNA-associated protein 4
LNAQIIKPRRVKHLTSELLPHVASGSDEEVSTGATALAFSPDSTKLVLATSLSSYTLVVDLGHAHDELDRIKVLRRFDHHRMRDVILRPEPVSAQAVNGHINGDSTMDVDEEASPPPQGDHDEIMDEDHNTSYETQVQRITIIGFSPDGQWLATCDIRRRVHVFNMDSIQVSTRFIRYEKSQRPWADEEYCSTNVHCPSSTFRWSRSYSTPHDLTISLLYWLQTVSRYTTSSLDPFLRGHAPSAI